MKPPGSSSGTGTGASGSGPDPERRRFRGLRRAAVIAPLALACSSLFSCGGTRPASIVVAISSETPVPKGIDSVQVTVIANGTTRLDHTYMVGPDATKLPSTLVVNRTEDSDPNTFVTVIVKGFAGQKEVLQRRATLGFVDDKQKLLRMPLQFACFDSSCKEGETCKAGACVADTADVTALPDFADHQVFARPGDCFERAACIEKTERETSIADFLALVAKDPTFFDKEACTLPSHDPAHPDSDINMGFTWSMHPDGEWTPVDFDSTEGWQFTDATRTRIKLAPGLCAELKRDKPRVKSLITAKGCPPKPATQPECPVAAVSPK